ncbi:MAG: GNAT family N-acetyltransferase [Anaerolineae bacterium]
MSDVIIRPLDLERDAESLATMWNASDLQWPNSWTRGVPVTAEQVRLWEDEDRTLIVYVADVDGQIAGYCSFMDDHEGLSGEGYLALLNVHPGYQKRSIGRKLIQATIERAVQEGWQRQTLGTWSANFKAVPTYKKTGHFWAPDTSVWMQNYIPGALQLSLAKPFFERHDWYRTYVRDLTQQEDDERWEGLKVFTQRWEADGESLAIWIDREARAPVAVDTSALHVAVLASDIEPLAGSKVTLRWRVANKGSHALPVFLHALGDQGLTIDHRDAFSVPPGETVERAAEVTLAEDAPSRKDNGTAPAVRSILRLGDDEVELFSGLRARKPLSLDTAPATVSVEPGRPSPVNLQLHSELDQPFTATVLLTPPEGLATDWARRDVELPARGHVALPVTLTATASGVYTLPSRVEYRLGDQPRSASESVTLLSVGYGGLECHQSGDSVRLETDSVRVTVSGKGGQIAFEDKAGQTSLLQTWASVGPPYHPGEFEQAIFQLALSREKDAARVSLSTEAKRSPGLWLHQTLTLSPSGQAELASYLENRAGQEIIKTFALGVSSAGAERERVTMPLRLGTVQAPHTTYPVAWDDAPSNPAEYAEPWMAWERNGLCAGFAWDSAISAIRAVWSLRLDGPAATIVPGGQSPIVRVALWAGRGDWRAFRDATASWRGQRPQAALETRPVVQARIEPAVLLTLTDEAEGKLVVDSASRRVASGHVSLRAPEQTTIDLPALPVDGLERGHPLERPVRVKLAEDFRGADAGQVRLDLPEYEVTTSFAVVRLGESSPVTVEQGEQATQEVWRIDNGLSRFLVAPGFGPSLVAWEWGGENQLVSTFPEPIALGWQYPFYAGINPVLRPVGWEPWEGLLPKAEMASEAISCDQGGIVWRGVRLSARPTRKELRDVLAEIAFLTVGASNVLRLVYRLRNLRDTAQRMSMSVAVAAGLGADPGALTLLGEGVRRKPGNVQASIGGQRWGAVTRLDTGKSLLMVGDQPDVSLEDMGQYGRLLGMNAEVHLAGGGVAEHVYHLVVANSLTDALAYRALASSRGQVLPEPIGDKGER